MSSSSHKIEVWSLLQQLREAGVVLGEGLAFDSQGIVLELRMRASATDLDPATFQFYFPFVVDKLVATLSENADLKESAFGSDL